MKNTLEDVHNILMEQLERINDAESLEELETEIKKSRAIEGVAKQIVANANVMLEAAKLNTEYAVNAAPKLMITEGVDYGK